ncbi:uncharacterized protein LOC117180792 isoform X2 [Belonocnema kinseyi]|uniref:uncharacterized protein LOC117180792 isoform X2 n=1 Tax=Belonocnema kinseyi TaxID=2817044 RepID=UPI00143D5D42|nr:uncharacterized protein LOC117180792 isoform X2 [Belonocnema kinseyi]
MKSLKKMNPNFLKPPEEFLKSTDSFGSFVLRENPLWNRGNEENEFSLKMKQYNSISKALISAVSRNKKKKTFSKYPTMVKTSALLYEITDRTNRLAQPRLRLYSDEKNPQRTEVKSNHIPEATPRVIELSRPRIIFKLISQPKCNVSPRALTAVATQRIIELSKPKKTRNSSLHRNKRQNHHTPCSARIEYLSKPRLFHQKMKRKSAKGQKSYFQKKNKKRNLKKKSRHNTYSKSCNKYTKLGRQNKKRKRFLKASGSSRSVIIFPSFEQCNHCPESRGRQCKKGQKEN